ncbi:Mut7-C RNAse domain-containing protein [Halohasta salina]|uniref:Mut7-C RNAse domain-containing protein n=1 Tax=Halohasta salina TaxID=2961621 RepID=UPI0020A49379|nr:Mut7-C RNAse domain-containing protein [Halohasta salina]
MTRRFLLDVMLGTLATYLRMCGYDTLYAQEEGLEADDAIRRRAASTDRTLLTRDRELAARTDDAILLTARDVDEQLTELHAHEIEIELSTHPERCSVCNGRVERIDPAQRPDHAPDSVSQIWQCEACDHHFWKGSHWERVRETIATIPVS